MTKRYSPFTTEINKNQTNVSYVGKFITFVVTGTWLVSIGNVVLMPGDVFPFDLQGADGEIELTPEIDFREDVSTDPSVAKNRRLKTGKFIEVIVLKLNP